MCWDCERNKGGDPFKDYRDGKVDVSDFDEQIAYRGVKSKKIKSKRQRGCPENDYKEHVYVWVDEVIDLKYFSKPYTVRRKTCCGCGKVSTTKYDW